jgi:DNA sulfur modification protein DndD
MVIDKIILNNFRVYQATHEITLATKSQNVTIISGNNGYGKTSFLTSLVWGLYGKLMADVDEKYRREIYESGGYKRYCEKILNRVSADDSYSVSILFSNLFIPYLPCDKVQVTRTYNGKNDNETIEILIDGRPNELTNGVGPEIFINDFILPKEIAKFFFFDAEKIVSLAEMRSSDEKKNLSQAYSEVLGIKKYLDLKENLENVRLRLRKKTYNPEDRKRLEKLQKQQEQNSRLIVHNEQMIQEKEDELILKKSASDKLQEQLIRSGTSITLEDLKDFQVMKETFGGDLTELKEKFKSLLELAPLAIASNKLTQLKKQVELEIEISKKAVSQTFLTKKIGLIKMAVKKNQKKLSLNASQQKILMTSISEVILSDKLKETDKLLGFSPEQSARFLALYKNIKGSYSEEFKERVADLKRQSANFNIVNRKLSDAESKENDPVIKAIRKDKIKLDAEIKLLEDQILNARVQKSVLQNENKNVSKQLSELTKLVGVEKVDREKDIAADRLIRELEEFIHKLKISKKASLEKNLLSQLNLLMHKSDFIKSVVVVIEGELIDIEFYDRQKQLINKDSLSKGEQQLYATALLKALIDESKIKFPVFIDSPLQKFDKNHSKSIILDFYPNISNQVVLLPLLDKEINEREYKWLLPKIGKSYLIQQEKSFSSQFVDVKPNDILKEFKKTDSHVYQH